MKNCGGHTHAKTNDVTWETLGEQLIKCKSDVTRWEAMPKGGGKCSKTAGIWSCRLLIDTVSQALRLTTSQLKHKAW